MTVLRSALCATALATLTACSTEQSGDSSAARVRLASISTAEAVIPGVASADRVWVPKGRYEAYDASPDGRSLAYVDWDTGNLGVHDVQTGVNRDLTKKGTYQDSEDEAENAVYSPDGKHIAYYWWDSKTKNGEVRVIASDGSGVRTVFREVGVENWPEEWTRDGRHILTILSKDNVHRLALIPADGGSPRVIKAITGRHVKLSASLSPDGRYMAYSVGEPQDDFQRHIHIVTVDDGRESAVVTRNADDVPVGWTADGLRLVFVSDRAGTPGLWAQRISGGRADGTPTLVRGDLWHMQPIRLTNQGRFFYDVAGGDRDVFVATFDPETGRIQAPPVSLTGHPGENYLNPQWSPDGKHVAYLKLEETGVRYMRIVIQSVGGTEVREFLPRIMGPRSVTWVPGSQSLMVNGSDRDGHPSLYRFDLNTGNATQEIPNTVSVPSFSPDGRTMYYVPRPQGVDTASRLLARDMATGKERQIYVERRGGRINANAVTADGRWVILVWAAKLGAPNFHPAGTFAISTETGEMRDLGATIPFDSAHQTRRHAGFTPDHKGVLIMVQRIDSMASFALWRAPLDGGRAVRLPFAPADIQQIAGPGSWTSPDGRRIVYVKGKQVREVWSLDDAVLRTSP